MPDLTQYATFAGIAVNTIAAAWIAVTVYLERRRRLEAELAQKERDDAMAAKRAQWEEDERAHKRRMEELALASVRQAGAAAKEAKQAKDAAARGQQKIVESIEASQGERRDQVADLKAITEKALEVNTNALTAANNVNAKIESYGKKLTDIPSADAPPR